MKIAQNTTLQKGFHYKTLPAKKIFKKHPYRFELIRMVEISFDQKLPIHKPVNFRDDSGILWAVLYPDGLKVYPRYEWDGCSPKIVLFGRFWGTPDFEKTLLASLVHDVTTQFDKCGVYLSRKEQDKLFLRILQSAGFKLSRLYFWGSKVGSKLSLTFSCL